MGGGWKIPSVLQQPKSPVLIELNMHSAGGETWDWSELVNPFSYIHVLLN